MALLLKKRLAAIAKGSLAQWYIFEVKLTHADLAHDGHICDLLSNSDLIVLLVSV